MDYNNFYINFDILCKSVENELKKHNETGAFKYFFQNQKYIKDALIMKKETIDKYNEIFEEQDLLTYYNEKCYNIYIVARKNNCYEFLSKFKILIKYEKNLYNNLLLSLKNEIKKKNLKN